MFASELSFRPMNVAIVGYGIAGITAAIQLRKLGHTITHFERKPTLAGGGAGMLLHPPALSLLASLGLATQVQALGACVRSISARTTTDKVLMAFSYADFAVNSGGVGIQRELLHQLLASADSGRSRVVTDYEVTAFDASKGLLTDRCKCQRGPFDLIVVADGTHSRLRANLQPAPKSDRPAATAALVGLLDDPESLACDRLEQYFSGNQHLSVWPAGRLREGAPQRMSIALKTMLHGANTVQQDSDWRRRINKLCPTIGALANKQLESSDLYVYSYRQVLPINCSIGRVVFIGDAAHSMSPQFGSGAQLALEDAIVLAQVLATQPDLQKALAVYGRRRAARVRGLHRASRLLTPVFQSNSSTLAVLRDHVFAKALRTRCANRLVHRYIGRRFVDSESACSIQSRT